MSPNCNGVRKHSKDKAKNGKRRFSVDAAAAKSYEVEDAFRGFAKCPVVCVTRTDISSYLKSMSQNSEGKTPVHKSLSKLELAVHSRNLAAKCSVSLLREDLKGLKMAFQNDPDNAMFKTTFNLAKLKCKICEKVYSSEKKLQNHLENKHIIYKSSEKTPKRVSFADHVTVHEVKEYHKCRKCTRIFEHYKLLKLHMKLKHKKRKCYICNYCNKNFVDRMFFKVHIKLHCDVCGYLAPNKSKYVEHRRKICRVLKLHKCKMCQLTFFKFLDVKDHSYDHIMPPSYVCDVCKDKFTTKCAIAHHLLYLHAEKRPTSLYTMRNLGSERLYLCNFCEESSVERDEIESHVALLPDLTNRAMTGYKDYYFCDQCFMKFDVETDMLQHKWTHFLKTSDNSQLRPKATKPEVPFKRIFKAEDKVPDYMQPKVLLEKIKVGDKELNKIDFVNVDCANELTGEIKRPVVDPASKKTIISKHQCQTCGKYYSTNYCLNRHIVTQHSDYESLKCKVCEETFVWPSLLMNHKCIRLNLPEIPFDDARPEIHFDNLHELRAFDDLPITDDYMNTVDFEIPAPIVELEEYGGRYGQGQNCYNGCKIVMQEVPIEF